MIKNFFVSLLSVTATLYIVYKSTGLNHQATLLPNRISLARW